MEFRMLTAPSVTNLQNLERHAAEKHHRDDRVRVAEVREGSSLTDALANPNVSLALSDSS